MNDIKSPDKGFYYHFKHDPDGPVNNYTYEVLGIAKSTEEENADDSLMVAYRPLYKDDWFKGTDFCVRPLKMFFDIVKDKNRNEVTRFSEIRDKDIVAKLTRAII